MKLDPQSYVRHLQTWNTCDLEWVSLPACQQLLDSSAISWTRQFNDNSIVDMFHVCFSYRFLYTECTLQDCEDEAYTEKYIYLQERE